jgi:hypothetical protein
VTTLSCVGESNLKAHEIVEKHHHRVVSLSEEYNKLKLRAVGAVQVERS